MARKTLKQKNAAIRVWRAKYGGKCPVCQHTITPGTLVCRDAVGDRVIHYVCHPDWIPAQIGPPLQVNDGP